MYHKQKQCVILVKQFRPVVYVNQVIEKQDLSNVETLNAENIIGKLDWSQVDPADAVTYELCAGICDKSKSLEETGLFLYFLKKNSKVCLNFLF